MLQLSVSSNQAYLPHVATMLHSAVSVEGQPPIEVQLLHGEDVQHADLAPLSSMLARHGSRLQTHLIDHRRLTGISDRRFSITAWYRVLLPEVLSAMRRVIHIDGDALVRKPLSELWTTDLGGAPFAAVQNPLYPWMTPAWERLGLAPGTAYPNSGVMVLDLDLLRAENAVDQLLTYGSSHPENPWPEQDALAAVFAGRWRQLGPRWNVQTIMSELPAAALPWDRASVLSARRDPAVLHFTGPLKPWGGWGPKTTIEAYLAHRAGSGYPLAGAPRRTAAAVIVPRLPLRLRRKAVAHVMKDQRET